MPDKQYQHFDEWEEEIIRNLCWGAGLLEENRPYFAEFWKVFGVTSLTVTVSSKDTEPAKIVQMIQKAGLIECINPDKAEIHFKKFTDDHGNEFTPLGYENLEAKRVMDLDNPPETIWPDEDYFVLDEATGKYICSICGYVYDPAEHDGVAFEDLPDDWKCPRCKQPKEKLIADLFLQSCGRQNEDHCSGTAYGIRAPHQQPYRRVARLESDRKRPGAGFPDRRMAEQCGL